MNLDHIKLPKETESLGDLHKQILRAFIHLGVGKQVTLEQIRNVMGLEQHEHQQLRRRFTDLREKGWNTSRVGQDGRTHLYSLDSVKQTLIVKADRAISSKDRAAVLHKAGSRCQMCGASPEQDGIKLVVDHKVPIDWGGENEISNYQSLCEDCNGGKKNFFATLDNAIMSKCMKRDSIHQRIGELLKAFKGEFVSADLISTVAQEFEWTRRIRELRDLGWKIKSKAEYANGRRKGQNSYAAKKWMPWPEDIREAIRQAAVRRGSKSLR